jgi:hypothetical protein
MPRHLQASTWQASWAATATTAASQSAGSCSAAPGVGLLVG